MLNNQQKYGKVAVVMGGNTPEREISLISGQAILEALVSVGIEAHAFDPAKQPLSDLVVQGFNRAFLIVHGKNGEDGKLQGAMEYLAIPYTGSGVMASAIGMDKYRTKLIWQTLNIPVAKSQYLEYNQYCLHGIKLELSLPVVVKPADDGSSLAMSKVYHECDLIPALEYAFKTSQKILIEQLIIGNEYTIPIINGEVYPVIKIEAPQGEYDYQNKYFTDDTKYLCPYNLGEKQEQIEQWALAAYHAIGASGVARLDFMQDATGQIYFLEINTLPGMTSHSLVPQSVASKGISFAQLCLLILDNAGLGK
ncbi:MAG: hypothetical protein RLZZ293_1419 [Pseudomonadota bacterium]|jgi:D-alanine-D-alanine ligase